MICILVVLELHTPSPPTAALKLLVIISLDSYNMTRHLSRIPSGDDINNDHIAILL